MKRNIHLVLMAGFVLDAFRAWAQTELQASIGSWQGYNIISIYGKAYHTNPAAISCTTGGLQMYAFTTCDPITLASGYPVFDATPKDENWGAGAPANCPNVENFACRWEGFLDVLSSGDYTLNGGADDLLRIYVDGQLIFYNALSGVYPGTVSLPAGRHTISWQFGEVGGGAWYGVSENVTGGNSNRLVAATGHPFAGYSLDYQATYSNAVTNALAMDIYAGLGYDPYNPTNSTLSSFRGTRIFRGAVNVNCWWASSDGPSTNDLFGTPEVGDAWACRLRGEMYFGVAGTNQYKFTGGADDQLQMYVDTNRNGSFMDPGEYVFNKANHPTSSPPANAVWLTNGWYPVQIEFYDTGGGQNFQLQRDDQQGGGWKYVGSADAPVRSAIPVNEWLSITNCWAPVVNGTNDGLLGIFNAKALSLPIGYYPVRLRVFDSATKMATDTKLIRVRELHGVVMTIR